MRILIAEDDRLSRHVLEATIRKWGHEPVVARDGQEAWKLLQGPDIPKLAILDWVMPGLDGVEVCRMVRRGQKRDYIYIILLTSRSRREDVVAGLEAGADDYLTKPFDSAELRVRLTAAQRIIELQSELIAARDAFREQATHDFLTGTWNRLAILDMLRKELERARREGTSVGLLMVDLDRFKQINDRLGHEAGDEVLQAVTALMKAAVRTYDSIGRYGGDEFLVVCPGLDCDQGVDLANRIRQAVSSMSLPAPEAEAKLTLSIGVACSSPGSGMDAEELIRQTDQAAYKAKSAGRDRVASACGGATGNACEQLAQSAGQAALAR